jgi:hypothetical protein
VEGPGAGPGPFHVTGHAGPQPAVRRLQKEHRRYDGENGEKNQD